MASLQSHFLTLSLPSFPTLSSPQQSLLPNLPLNFISNHHIHTFKPKFCSTKKMTSFLTTKASSVDIVTSLVQSSPATWQSSIVANAVIFVLGSPVLVSGLSVAGIVSAFLLGTLTWRAFGFSGFGLVATYFVLGTVATKVKMAQKEAQGIAEKKKGRRGPASVIGSSAAGCVCACLSIYGLGGKALSQLWQLGFVASFCTKLSDTVSSEIGKAYGKTTYLVTTFKIVPRGTEGAVSVEGTLAGVLASILLACVGCLNGQINTTQAVGCVLASQIANFGESFIGASFQDKEGFQWLNNDVVNIINISVGSIFAISLQLALQSCQR